MVNTISSYLEYKDVSPVNLNKETSPLSLDAVSQNNSISKLKAPLVTENKNLLSNQILST